MLCIHLDVTVKQETCLKSNSTFLYSDIYQKSYIYAIIVLKHVLV